MTWLFGFKSLNFTSFFDLKWKGKKPGQWTDLIVYSIRLLYCILTWGIQGVGMFLNHTYTIPPFVDWHVASGWPSRPSLRQRPSSWTRLPWQIGGWKSITQVTRRRWGSGLLMALPATFYWGYCMQLLWNVEKEMRVFRASCSASQKAKMVMVKLYNMLIW